MKNNRYNSFNQVHKGLRVFLYETATNIQVTDMSDAEAGAKVIEQIEDVLFLFESHAHGEDHFFNEPLEKINPEVSSMFLKEHEEDHRLSIVLTDLVNQWKNATNSVERIEAGRNIMYAFNEFVAFNLYHMNKEEIELNRALWAQYTDEEIKGIEQTLVQQIPPQKMAKYAKWMIRGINDNELLHWFNEVHQFAPQPVFTMLSSIAEDELARGRYEKLMEQIAVTIHA